MLLFFVRIYVAEGFYIVCYALFIYLLNVFIHFITPKANPDTDGPILPQGTEDEFRPFERKLPEFKFWWACVRATIIAFLFTITRVTDIPVYWPILLIYFIVLFALTMKKEITKWIQLGYVPWSRKKLSSKWHLQDDPLPFHHAEETALDPDIPLQTPRAFLVAVPQ